MIARARKIVAFWYDFVVGDDWRVAIGVVIALALTAVLALTSVPSWWILVVAVLILLPASLRRATRTR